MHEVVRANFHTRLRLPSLAGNGLPERMRSTAFAFLGLTAAAGLALVAIFAQLGFPLLSPAPLPSEPPPGHVAEAVALERRPPTIVLPQGAGSVAPRELAAAEAEGGRPAPAGTGVGTAGGVGAPSPVSTPAPAPAPPSSPTPAAQPDPAPVAATPSEPKAKPAEGKPPKETAKLAKVVAKPAKSKPGRTKSKPAKSEPKAMVPEAPPEPSAPPSPPSDEKDRGKSDPPGKALGHYK
jgi:hypothetical protein